MKASIPTCTAVNCLTSSLYLFWKAPGLVFRARAPCSTHEITIVSCRHQVTRLPRFHLFCLLLQQLLLLLSCSDKLLLVQATWLLMLAHNACPLRMPDSFASLGLCSQVFQDAVGRGSSDGCARHDQYQRALVYYSMVRDRVLQLLQQGIRA